MAMQHPIKTAKILKEKISTVNLSVPSSYRKLSKKQIKQISRWFVRRVPKAYMEQRVLYLLSGLKLLRQQHGNKKEGKLLQAYKYQGQVIYIDVAKLPDMLKSVQWIFDKVDLIKPVYKRLLFRHAPDEALYNCIWDEFISADIESFHYSTTGKMKHLNCLCSILYRQSKSHAQKSHKSYNGDVRIPFNSHAYKRNAWYWYFVSPAKKYTVYLYFAGCKESFQARFPNVFGASVNSSKPIHPGESYLKSTTLLSGDDATKVEKLYKTKLYTALEVLDSILGKLEKK